MNETEVLKKDDEDDIEVIEEAEEEAKPEPEKASEEAKSEPEREVRPQKSSDEDLSTISDSVKKRIDKLTFKMREAERREQAALEYARSLQAESQAFKQKAAQLDNSLINEYENRVKTQHQLVVDKLKAAVESGDVDAQIEAQKALSSLAVEEERIRVVKNRPQPQVAPQPAPQMAPQQRAPARPDPRAEAWAEKNDWFGQDKAMTATAFVIHSQLVEEEGYDPASDDYYSELDRRIQGEFPHKFKRQSSQQEAPTSVAGARPTGRSDSNPKQVKLTRSQIEIARKLGVSVKDYARQLQKLAR